MSVGNKGGHHPADSRNRSDQHADERAAHREAKVLATEYEGDDIIVCAVVPALIAGRLAAFAMLPA